MNVSSQEIDLVKKAKEITDEGTLLYKLELAAWHGTDIFYNSFKEPERIGGYFSYLDSNKPKCVFFSKSSKPRIIGSMTFGDIQIVETANIDFRERDFSKTERDLYEIRQKALAEIQEDSLFVHYTNSSLNLIPIIYKSEKKVYVLTGPKNAGVVLFGNDYLLTFDNNNKLKDKKQLHRNLIPVEFSEDKPALATVHSHAPETGDFITPTDICTLLLYGKFAKWKEHIVISQSYVSIWDCEKESLRIVTTDEFDKMYQN